MTATGMARSLVVAENVNTRLFVLWGMGIALCVAGWLVGFLLPERTLTGLFPVAEAVPTRSSAADIARFIVVYNLGIAGGLIVLANLFRVGGWPLGYLPVLFHWTFFGLFNGSNSFGVDQNGRIPLNAETLLTSVGFAEITAYTFIAAATASIAIFSQRSLFTMKGERIGRLRDVRLNRCELLTIAAAVALLFASGYRETLSILG